DIIQQKGFEPIKAVANLALKKFDSGMSLMQLMGELEAQTGVKLLFHSKYTSVPAHDIHELRLQIVPTQAYRSMTLKDVQDIMATWADNGVIDLAEAEMERITAFILKLERRHYRFSNHLNHLYRRRNKQEQYQSLHSLGQELGVDWDDYLKPLKLENVEQVHLWASRRDWIKEIEYFLSLDRNLLRYYTLWRLSLAHFNKLSDPYYSLWKNRFRKRAIKMGFYSVDKSMTFLRHDCVKETGANLKYLAGHIYIKYAFNSTQKHEATVMVDNLLATLRSRFFQLSWMDKKTRKAAIKKLDNLTKIVGFPDWVMDPYKVAEYYRPLKLKPDTYFENAIQAQIFTELMPSIRHSRSNDIERQALFKDHMWLLNAVHLVNLVQVQINPGFIQRPLFSQLNPPAMNYGSLGAVIGHELTHAFDSFGSQFDSEGVRRPWMSPASQAAFDERAECFVNQYSAMDAVFSTGKKQKVDGRHTLTENIADNGGMHTAFAAWSRLESKKGIDIYAKQSPADKWTPAQIFWLSYAQTNCDVESDRKLKRQLKRDVHSPKPIRVNGAVRNSMEFAKAFKCPLHSPMHPLPVKKTCRIM
ncbi:Endothelin-converting enzyme 2, partial [Kappamyces sp. JEL0680]